MTYAEYCTLERHSTIKHEYLRGDVFAMPGGSPEHGRLGGRAIHLLTLALAERACNVFTSDVRVRIEATDLDTYPDVSVVCGKAQTTETGSALLNPILIVEVLSDSTEAYDRGQKAAHYRRIPSLRAYLMVSQSERLLELQLRNDDGSWALREAGTGEVLVIEPLGITLDVDELYHDPAG